MQDQTYPNVRCVVVDNGSTDGTADAVARVSDPRVTLVRLELNCGAAAARNAGLAAAAGSSWVGFLDDDDLWAPAKVELQLGAVAAAPAARWSATSCVHVGPDLQVRWAARLLQRPLTGTKQTLVSSTEMLALLKDDQRVPAGGSSVLAARDLVLDVGGFDRDVAGCEDWDLWLRLAQASPLAYVDLPLVAYRVWDGQASAHVRAQVRSAKVLRQRYFPEAGALPDGYRARWEQEAGATSCRWQEAGPGRLSVRPGRLGGPPTRPIGVRRGRRHRPFSGRRTPPAHREGALSPWAGRRRSRRGLVPKGAKLQPAFSYAAVPKPPASRCS